MSTTLSLLVQSGRAAAILGNDREPSGSGVELRLSRDGAIDRPVDLARALKRYGLSLRQAHGVLNALVEDKPVTVAAIGLSDDIIRDLAQFGVLARPI